MIFEVKIYFKRVGHFSRLEKTIELVTLLPKIYIYINIDTEQVFTSISTPGVQLFI